MPFVAPNFFRDQFGVEGRVVLLTLRQACAGSEYDEKDSGEYLFHSVPIPPITGSIIRNY